MFLWLRKNGNGKGKGIKEETSIFGTFFYENNGNEEKREMKGHMLHLRRKIMENEDKIEASSIKMILRINWYPFASSLLELYNYSLSLSLTLRHLDFLGTLLHWNKKRNN